MCIDVNAREDVLLDNVAHAELWRRSEGLVSDR
jgi:hypothetical protein